MTVVATIHCKICRAVFALFSDTLFSLGGREKTLRYLWSCDRSLD